MIRDYVIDMEFVPFDENGLIIQDVVENIPCPMLRAQTQMEVILDLCFLK